METNTKKNTFSIFTSNFYEGEKVLVIVFFYCNMFNKYTLNVLILKGEAQNLFKNLKPEKEKNRFGENSKRFQSHIDIRCKIAKQLYKHKTK